jgi:hypothetical protein
MWSIGKDHMGVSLERDDQLDLEALDEIIADAFKKIPQPEFPELSSVPDTGSELFVWLSDQHIGAATSDDGLYENPYNEEEVHKRFAKLITEIIKLNKAHRIAKIKVGLLGDTFDGMDRKTTRGGHDLPQNMTNREAFECFLTSHVNFINSLTTYITSDVELHITANSNHGGDFEYVAHRAFQIMFDYHPTVQSILYPKFLGHFETDRRCYVLTHGKDKKNRFKGMPKNLNEETENFIAQYLRKHKITKPVRVIKGDLHTDTEERGNLVEYRNVPSFFGGSDWVHDNFGLCTPGVGYELQTPDGFLFKGIFEIT